MQCCFRDAAKGSKTAFDLDGVVASAIAGLGFKERPQGAQNLFGRLVEFWLVGIAEFQFGQAGSQGWNHVWGHFSIRSGRKSVNLPEHCAHRNGARGKLCCVIVFVFGAPCQRLRRAADTQLVQASFL